MYNVLLYAVAFTILLVMLIYEMSEVIVDATKNELTVRTLAIALGSAATIGILIIAYRNQTRRKVSPLDVEAGTVKDIQGIRADLDLLRAEVELLKEQLRKPRAVSFSRENGGISRSCLKGARPMSPAGFSMTSDEEYFTDVDEEWHKPSNSHPAPAPIATPRPGHQFQEIFARFDQMFEEQQGADEQYTTLLKLNSEHPDDYEILWRLARACNLQSGSYDKKDPRKKEKLLEGRKFGQRGCELAPNELEAIKWAAVLTGSVTDYLPTKERIEQGNVFKEYLDRALAISPADFIVLHMRGRFAYNVSQLSWVERKMAATFFSEPPSATIDEAVRDCQAAYKEKPDWHENLLWLAKAHLASKNKSSARKVLEEAINLQPKDDTARGCVSECRELLAKC